MKKKKIGVEMKAVFTLIAGTLLSTSVFADVVIVDGLVHKLNKSDFVQQGNTYVKTLEVIGDTGNTLVFDRAILCFF